MAYKVVTPKLNSCLHIIHGRKVHYKINEWVTPQYPSFVFKDLETAREWVAYQLAIARCVQFQIWRCRTEGLRKANAIISLYSVRRLLSTFWELVSANRVIGGNTMFIQLKPKANFYITNKVMLTKRVD